MSFLRRVLLLPSALVFALAAGCADNNKDTGPTADASFATGDAGTGALPFLSECTSNEQCTTNLCFNFGNKGPHCSHPCTVATDCEAPSPGCNGMGVCKAP